mgnify:CR=1 FL=1
MIMKKILSQKYFVILISCYNLFQVINIKINLINIFFLIKIYK